MPTQPTDEPVDDFLRRVTPVLRREDGEKLVEIFAEVTGVAPVMWGPSMIGISRTVSGSCPPSANTPRAPGASTSDDSTTSTSTSSVA